MKIFKIAAILIFALLIVSCGGKSSGVYDYPDDDPTETKGDIGAPCKIKDDCKEGLLCIDKVCTEKSDEDPADTGDTQSDDDTDTGDSQSDTGDSQSDEDTTDTGDTQSDDDTDTGDTQSDTGDTQPDSGDTADDQDITPIQPECGNGVRDQGEECDNGDLNSDEPGIVGVTCRTNCLFAMCGDNIVDTSEKCDDGNRNDGDYCSSDCSIVTGYCGDGIIQSNEFCDKKDDPYCSDDCKAAAGYCGDGIKQSNEVCDRAEKGEGGGEGIGPYYCSVNCKEIIGSCGDGIIQLNETCDDGDSNGRYGYCNATCDDYAPYCGDGIKQQNEACDDGENNGRYCSDDCQTSYGSCGDGIVQDFEACDKAAFGSGVGSYCSDDCTELLGYCGDGIKQANEQCDKGLSNGLTTCPYGPADACEVCTSNCKISYGTPKYCGDGIVDPQEACDIAASGNGNGAYCSFDCTQMLGYCGDGIVQEFEACDTANSGEGIGPEYCAADCKSIIGYCGDGIKQANETCDKGQNNGNMNCPYGEKSCRVCTNLCTETDGNPSYCGDGNITDGEICDSGSSNGQYYAAAPGLCNSDCKGKGEGGFCGDGNADFTHGEECDNGEHNGEKDCAYGLKNCVVCTNSCKEAAGKTAYCGDGIKNGNESCDDGKNNGKYGFCSADCYNQGERCGDGTVNGNEICDDGDLNGTYGHCNSDCTGLGERCGDGTVNGSEFCDDGDNNGKYRQSSPGYCNSDCSARGGFCGDGVKQENEECEHGGVISTTCAYGEENCEVCASNCTLQNGSTSYCGDGITDPNNGEICDDGKGTNGLYGGNCNADCSGYTPVCGDGNVDTAYGEVCDEGEALNGTYGHCKADCSAMGEYCGDGIQNGYEFCDEGEALNGTYGHCKADCSGTMPKCGDGNIDSEYGEICDDGNLNGEYNKCGLDCKGKAAYCGDGNTDSGNEECDNGSHNGDTACAYGETSCTLCTNTCTQTSGTTSYCGDEITDDTNGEVCDEGILNGTYGHCSADCRGAMPKCGDGNIDSEYGETCDEGDLNGEYGHCNSSCTGTSECGDGIQNGTEFCDNGPFNGHYGFCNSDCTAITGSCGDGIIQNEVCGGLAGCTVLPDGNEECDNGYKNGETECAYGLKSCDVCTNSCKLAAGTASYCGDGTVNGPETCDDGSLNGTYNHCKSDCSGIKTARCGDGNIDYEDGESCDEGDGINGTIGHCSATCNGQTPYCGDGIVQRENCREYKGYGTCVEVPGMNENCDEGELNIYSNICHTDCSGRCGDGIVNGPEVCDDGDEFNGSIGHCSYACDGMPECGNGVIETGEACDDGEDNGKYNHCDIGCSNPGVGGRCGDGRLQVSDPANCGTWPLCDAYHKEDCCEIVTFASTDSDEICDEGDENNGYHGHCDLTCHGISSCGDGEVGYDEICEPGEIENEEEQFECSSIAQFKGSAKITECDINCMPILTACENADSYTSPFFTTSQTLCYDNSAVITCPAEGSDFYGQDPNHSYMAQIFTTESTYGGDIVTEVVSGLMWQADTPSYYGYEKDEDLIVYNCQAETSCTLEEARDICSNLSQGVYYDWRLPTAAEFSTIMDYASAGIYSGFTNSRGAYWTEEGMVVSTTDGTSYASAGTAQVKCVRSDNKENRCSAFQCQKQDDLFILDFGFAMLTGYEDNFVFWYFDNPMHIETWKDALAFCESADINGFNKMRLPTANELISLIDRTNGGSLISGFSGTAWTSTTLNSDASQAYIVDFSDGSVMTDTKTNTNTVICIE